MSLEGGIPPPPSSIRALTVASAGFFPLANLSFLKRPLSPGPIFFSSLSGLGHIPHCCSNTALPLAASPLPADSMVWEPAARPTHNVSTRNRCIVRRFSRARSKYLTPRIGTYAALAQVRRTPSGQQLLRGRAIGDRNHALVEDGHVLHQASDVGALFQGDLVFDPVGERDIAEEHAFLQDQALTVPGQHAVFTRVVALLHAQVVHEVLQRLVFGHRLGGAQRGI